MPSRLIVNADDFGLTRGINRAILELHTAGVLPSATLMARGPAFADAVALAKRHPTLGVGCHVVLTDGFPVSPPKTIPTLLGPDPRSLRPTLSSFILAVLRGQLRQEELEREVIAQIRSLQAEGLHVTHLDTHKHTHVLPQVARALLRAAEITGVRAVRLPFEPFVFSEEPWSLRLSGTGTLRTLAVAGTHLFRSSFLALSQLRNGAVQTTKGTVGIAATGCLTQATLTRILDHLPDGTWELCCHPGYNDSDLDSITTRLRASRDIERQALLACLSNTQKSNPQNPKIQNAKRNEDPQSPKHNSPHRPRPELIHYGRLAERCEPESETS